MSLEKSKPLPAFMKVIPSGVVFNLYVQPGARKTEPVGLHGDALKIKVQAPPIDGKANAVLIKWLAEFFGVGSHQIKMLSGEKNRKKVFELKGLDSQRALRLLRDVLKI